MTHLFSNIPLLSDPSPVLPAPRVIKAGLKGEGGWGALLDLWPALDTLLSVNPLKKPFLVKLDLVAFFFCLKAALALGGLFIKTSLSRNRDKLCSTNGKF